MRSSGRTQWLKDSGKRGRAAHLKERMLATGRTRIVGEDGAVTSLFRTKGAALPWVTRRHKETL